MYLIARSANLTLPIRERKVDYYPNGEVQKVRQPLTVVFQHAGTVPDYAREAVKSLPGWGNGIGLNEDPFTRCGSLDTEVEAVRQGWNEEELEAVDAALLNGTSNGVEYVIASKPRAKAPWPTYDKVNGSEEEQAFYISKKVVEDGWDPKNVLTYEVENDNRPLVVDALKALAAEADADVVGVISA